MKAGRSTTVVALVASILLSSCKKTESTGVKSEAGDKAIDVACDLGNSWWLSLGSITQVFGPGIMLAAGALLAVADGALQRSPACAKNKGVTAQPTLKDIAIVVRDQINDAFLDDWKKNTVTTVNMMMHYVPSAGGDVRFDLTSWRDDSEQALQNFDRFGILEMPNWAFTMGLRLTILKAILKKSIDAHSPQATIDSDVNNIIHAIDGIRPRAGGAVVEIGINNKIDNIKADADKRANTGFFAKDNRAVRTYFSDGSDFGTIMEHKYCRDPIGFTATEQAYMDAFTEKDNIPLTMQRRKAIIDAGAICNAEDECQSEDECNDIVNKRVAAKIADIAASMKIDYIDHSAQVQGLLAGAAKLRETALSYQTGGVNAVGNSSGGNGGGSGSGGNTGDGAVTP